MKFVRLIGMLWAEYRRLPAGAGTPSYVGSCVGSGGSGTFSCVGSCVGSADSSVSGSGVTWRGI
jgi:hypothetical protein